MKPGVDISANVIGGLMLDNSKVLDIELSATDFADQTHAEIFKAITALIADNQPADAVTVAEWLEVQTGRKWFQSVVAIARQTISAANVSHYADLLRADSKRRQAVMIADRLKSSIKENPDAVDDAIRELMALDIERKNYDWSIGDALIGAVDLIKEAEEKNGGLVGVPSGLDDLDKCLGGFQSPDLYVIGARPSQGKTAMLLNFANACNVSCGIISTEQGRDQIGLRSIAIHGRVSAHKMRLADLQENDYSRITASVMHLSKRKIRINDKSVMTIQEVVRQARKWKFQYGIEILFVDYIQRIRFNSNAPKHERVEEVVVGLKSIARELEIPVVALAQVNREVEKRSNKRPGLSDMKDSGAIEQEADNIITLYRDEVYDRESKDAGIAELAVMKNRHGPTGFIRCVWTAEFMRFDDFTSRPDYG